MKSESIFGPFIQASDFFNLLWLSKKSKTLLSPTSASAGRLNFLIPSSSNRKDDTTSIAKVNFSLANSVKYPIKAIGIKIVIPIASILLKQKNSLKPIPYKEAKRGPISNIDFGFSLRPSMIFVNP